jgi:hypothetical protein
MGAQGLTSALRSHCTQRPMRLALLPTTTTASSSSADGTPAPPPSPAAAAAPPGRACSGAGRVLLVDASTVMYHVVGRLGLERVGVDDAGDVFSLVHDATAAYVAKLQLTGLRLVFVTDSGFEPVHVGTFCARRVARVADGGALSPAVEAAFLAALAACACACAPRGAVEVHHAARGADRALLAYYRRHTADVFALLTGDSDFFVYGVRPRTHTTTITTTQLRRDSCQAAARTSGGARQRRLAAGWRARCTALPLVRACFVASLVVAGSGRACLRRAPRRWSAWCC